MPDPKRTNLYLPKTLPTLPGGQYQASVVPQGYTFGQYQASAVPQGYRFSVPQAPTVQASVVPQGYPFGGGQGSVVPPNAQMPNGELYYPTTVASGGGAGQLPPSGLSVGGGAPPKQPPVNGAGAGGGKGGGQPPALNPLEASMRAKIDAALGQGFYDDYKARTGQSPVDRYRNPRMLFWDEPNTPEGAANSFVRDELMNAQNAQRWQELHGDTPIPQEQWERWYYANRQGMRPDDVNQDGNKVVY